MPTPNDFSDYRFTPQQDDYKASALEQKDRSALIKDNEPLLPGPAHGNYPRTFDQGYGPATTEAAGDYPDCYSNIRVPGSTPKSGEYGQCRPEFDLPEAGSDLVPTPSPSKQFSSKMSGDPKELLKQATGVIKSHASLNEAYGLCQPEATLGSHPWLRDSLATPGEDEPGNSSPDVDKTPFAGRR